jgi:hypothetical protein
LVGESMRGKDQRVLPLLYALAFFAVTETEMNQIGLSVQDKETIKKVNSKKENLTFKTIIIRPRNT